MGKSTSCTWSRYATNPERIKHTNYCHQHYFNWICNGSLEQETSYPGGDNSYHGIYLCTGPLFWLIWFNKGLEETRALWTNKIWLKGWNSGLFKWGQVFTQDGTRAYHRQAWHQWYIVRLQQAGQTILEHKHTNTVIDTWNKPWNTICSMVG